LKNSEKRATSEDQTLVMQGRYSHALQSPIRYGLRTEKLAFPPNPQRFLREARLLWEAAIRASRLNDAGARKST
jgi:hypothetical protein